MLNKRSTTCFGHSGRNKPLVVYDSKEQARHGAEYVLRKHRSIVRPYHCTACHFWHLGQESSKTRQSSNFRQETTRKHRSGSSWHAGKDTNRKSKSSLKIQPKSKKSSICFSPTGRSLTEYPTQEAAKEQAAKPLDKSGRLHIETYRCNTCSFWHIHSMDERDKGRFKRDRGVLTELPRKSGTTHKSNATGTRKSNTCFGNHHEDGAQQRKPLTEYQSLEDAAKGALQANICFGNNLVPYHCNRKNGCHKWHLTPDNKSYVVFQPSIYCHCTNSRGCPKGAYPTQEDARRTVHKMYTKERAQPGLLRVYQCREGLWHLSHTRERLPQRTERTLLDRIKPTRNGMAPPIL